MGVDHFPCDFCGASIADCGTWWDCEVCEHRLCADCSMDQVAEDADTGDEVCPYCSHELATDTDLLGFALTKLGMTRDELHKEYLHA